MPCREDSLFHANEWMNYQITHLCFESETCFILMDDIETLILNGDYV